MTTKPKDTSSAAEADAARSDAAAELAASGSAEPLDSSVTHKDAVGQADTTRAVVATDPTAAVGGDLIGAGEKIAEALYDVVDEAVQYVRLKGDLLEQFYADGAKRPSYRLKFHSGQVVPLQVVLAHNAAVEKAAVTRENLAAGKPADPDNPAGIDSTTLASGTLPGLKV